MAKHPSDHDNDKDKMAEKAAEERRQAEEKRQAEKQAEERRRQQAHQASSGGHPAEQPFRSVDPRYDRPETGFANKPVDRPGIVGDRTEPRQPGPGNDRVDESGRAPSGSGYPDGEPRQPVPEGTDVRTPAVSSPENPAAPRPPDQSEPQTRAGQVPPGGDAVLAGVKKGDLVRLLVPHYDGFQLFAADSVVRWWNDEPPTTRNAALPDTELTPLNAPPMTDGVPPDDYVDPSTGRKPVIGSV